MLATGSACRRLALHLLLARMSTFLDELTARGFVQDATPGAAERLADRPITGYAGFDPTAPSLHVGNLVPVMGLAWLQRQADRAGWRRHRHGRRSKRQAFRAPDAHPGGDQ